MHRLVPVGTKGGSVSMYRLSGDITAEEYSALADAIKAYEEKQRLGVN
jgi:hypothetical protein